MILASVEALSKKPPLQAGKGKWWEYVTEFDVEIDEGGTYTVEVTGKKAKGSVIFIVESN